MLTQKVNNGSTSQLSEKCQKCPHVNVCDKKRMEACAYMKMPDQILEPTLSPAAEYANAEVLVKHDYRDIKIGPNTTVALDLEEVKRQLARNFYKADGWGLEFGA